MKRLWLAVVVLACVSCGSSDQALQSPTDGMPVVTATPEPAPWPTPYPEKEGQPPVYVFIHLWYTAVPERCGSPGGAAGGWGPWVWGGRIDDPCAVISGAPWLREISSPAYPLTGPYESGNEDVMRWQIRQAKAAGIDGFFTGVYSWAPHLDFVFDNFFGNPVTHRKGLLQIAHEENFKVGIEGWGPSEPNPPAQRGPCIAEVARHVAAIETSPYRDAYITIQGKPAYWLIVPQWMSERDQVTFFDGTPEHPRSFNWLLRGNFDLQEVVALNERLERSQAQYVSFDGLPSFNGWERNPGFADDQWRILQMPETGMIPISHTYTGYDERSGRFKEPYRGRFGLRNGTEHIRDFLEDSITYGAQIILCESWNEFGEGSMVEASVNIVPWRDMGQERDLFLDDQGQDDPYRYLKIFSEFNGMQEWVPPRPPPCSIVDPLMLQFSPLDLEKSGQCTSVADRTR